MRKLVYLAVLLSLVLFPSTVAAYEYDPPSVPVHPILQKSYTDFFPPKVLTVTEGVYVARGFNRDNPTLIEGEDGLIVVDPGESILAGEKAKAGFNKALGNIFDMKPVKAIIYTHDHDCHINGASVFADDPFPAEPTEIIGHEGLMDSLYGEWFGQVYPSRAEGGVKMGGILFQDSPTSDPEGNPIPGWYAGYVLGGPQFKGPEGFLPPTTTIKERTLLTIAGVEIELIPVAGESPDVLLVWLPQKEVLIEIAVLYEAFPALATMRGSRLRDPLDYVNALKVCRSLEPEHLVALHGANPVTDGKEEVRQYLTNFSDAIQFLNDQTVQYLNKGLTAGEMKDLIVLPDHLANNLYLQETYGSKDWDIFHIFRYYRGYYTGAVRDLFPQSTESEAEMSAFLAKGTGDLARKAEEALKKGKPEWALRIADDALVVYKDRQESRAYKDAFETKKAAMLVLAEQTMNSQARNMLLSDYLLMTGQNHLPLTFGDPEFAFKHIQENAVELMPMNTVNRIMAVNLQASKAIPVDMFVGLQLTDPGAEDHYTFHVRKGILEVNPPGAGADDEAFVIRTDVMTWKNMVLYKLAPEAANVQIDGGTAEDFYAFMDLFDFE